MGVPPQAALRQVFVGGRSGLGEMGEEGVGQQPSCLDYIGALAHVEGPHQHTKGVNVGPSGDLQAEGEGSVITLRTV